mmetsp:Transcript_33623/g.78847  ORF Transcript_33623/g.78847 Transcript_33623/m.78847 type:complete len:171 (-) Transcript_33623:1288-1800(-)
MAWIKGLAQEMGVDVSEVYLVAHDGYKHDFDILYKQMKKAGVKPLNVRLVDCLLIFSALRHREGSLKLYDLAMEVGCPSYLTDSALKKSEAQEAICKWADSLCPGADPFPDMCGAVHCSFSDYCKRRGLADCTEKAAPKGGGLLKRRAEQDMRDVYRASKAIDGKTHYAK